jgi:hypothetical protein
VLLLVQEVSWLAGLNDRALATRRPSETILIYLGRKKRERLVIPQH